MLFVRLFFFLGCEPKPKVTKKKKDFCFCYQLAASSELIWIQGSFDLSRVTFVLL